MYGRQGNGHASKQASMGGNEETREREEKRVQRVQRVRKNGSTSPRNGMAGGQVNGATNQRCIRLNQPRFARAPAINHAASLGT
ncbi:uncharacterized protein EAE97_004716 [Botrytis byssoidea]|uniref:Uncharacterized protein n=1 Tax=Botrytis byssoidea TaxID=139641 RepID=A0A9P5INB7_9HELO|nr:uncharacterized protein EAE97_004716 [Botrytis byssoidea]KAF7945678.1 hypothetical protein EAE97_004716 [Botrytis byssoidea]